MTATIDNISYTVKLPSDKLRIPLNTILEANKTRAIVLDFDADESLHRTGNNKIIMLPVIHLQEKEADIEREGNHLMFRNIRKEVIRLVRTNTQGVTDEGISVTQQEIDASG